MTVNPPMLFEVRAAPPFMTNGFVLACADTREGVIIDPGDCVEELLAVVRAQQLTIAHILLTHAHLDHITGVGRAKAATGATVVLHKDDRLLYDTVVQQGMMFGLRVEKQPPVDAFYGASPGLSAGPSPGPGPTPGPSHGSLGSYRFGRYEIRVYHTPGHSPGGVCLQVVSADGLLAEAPGAAPTGGTSAATLIVGDTLFAGSIGRTDLPGGDFDTLIRSIRGVLFAFGDDAAVYPGHGDSTTIGHERRTNPFLV